MKHLYGNVTYYKNSKDEDCVRIKLDEPVESGLVSTHSAENAFTQVLAHAGASLYRDGVDARYMQEAADGTTTYTGSAAKTGDGKTITHLPGIIDFVKDQGGYTLESTSRPEGFDSDGDGMSDEWETANGLNPNDASDAKKITLDTEKGWYTNLEVYMNSLVEDIMKAENTDAEQSVDEYYPACVKTGIAPLKSNNILTTEYYSLGGFRLDAPRKGVMIRVERMADGSKNVSKVIK